MKLYVGCILKFLKPVLSAAAFCLVLFSVSAAENKLVQRPICELLLSRTGPISERALVASLTKDSRELPPFQVIQNRENRNLMDEVLRKGSEGKLFVTGEIAVLKELNDSYYEDKDLVTRIVDMHKDIFLEELMGGNHLDLLNNIDYAYSDFKTLRFVFDNDSSILRAEVNKVLVKVNTKFARVLKNADMIDEKKSFRGLIRFPELWFLLGVGKSADEAGYAARTARSFDNPIELSARSFESVEQDLVVLLKEIETMRSKIQNRLEEIAPDMLQGVSDVAGGKSIKTLRRFVIKALLRTKPKKQKTEGLSESELLRVREGEFSEYLGLVQARLNQAFNLPDGILTRKDVEDLKFYISGLDHLAPGIFVEDRVILDFSRASKHVVSMDFTGLNLWNFEQTAYALARSYHNGIRDVREVLREVRKGEQAATKFLEEKKEFVRLVFGESFNSKTEFTGDDGATFPESLTMKDRVDVVKKLASSCTPSCYRLTFVDKDLGNVEAELIEKDLRVELEKSITLEEQANLVLVVDMTAYTNDGVISLWPGSTKSDGRIHGFIKNAFTWVLKHRGYLARQVKSAVVHPFIGLKTTK